MAVMSNVFRVPGAPRPFVDHGLLIKCSMSEAMEVLVRSRTRMNGLAFDKSIRLVNLVVKPILDSI